MIPLNHGWNGTWQWILKHGVCVVGIELDCCAGVCRVGVDEGDCGLGKGDVQLAQKTLHVVRERRFKPAGYQVGGAGG